MTSDRFVFRSVWRVGAPTDSVFSVLADFETYPLWWPQVQSVRAIEGGFATVCRSHLPYSLCFDTLQGRFDPEAGVIEGVLHGDLEGRAVWRVTPGESSRTNGASGTGDVSGAGGAGDASGASGAGATGDVGDPGSAGGASDAGGTRDASGVGDRSEPGSASDAGDVGGAGDASGVGDRSEPGGTGDTSGAVLFYEQDVRLRSGLRHLLPLARPAFRFNHWLMMRSGEQGLDRFLHMQTAGGD
jgi:hypothetical protein